MPANRKVFYFEVKIENVKGCPDPEIGIGFCEEHVALSGMVGWYDGSWGFHGDDGNLYEGFGTGRDYSEPFAEGDLIGCGVDFQRKSAFYTRNGDVIGKGTCAVRVN
jgi:hypothetical protein